jgi:hypothetical protein
MPSLRALWVVETTVNRQMVKLSLDRGPREGQKKERGRNREKRKELKFKQKQEWK